MRLEYQLAAVGEGDLKRALRSVEAEVEANARKGTARDNRRLKHTKKTAQQEEAARVKSEQKAATAAERAAAKERKVKEREAKRAADARIREEKRVSREQEKQLKWRQAIQNRHYQQLERESKKAEREAVRARKRTASQFTRGLGRTAAGTIGAVGGGLRLAGSIVGIGGGIAAAGAMRSQMTEMAMASQLANQAGDPRIKGQLLREAQTVKGMSGEEALSGLTAFTDLTGDLDTARRLLKDLATFSHATATSFEDATGMAGNFANLLNHIEDPAEKAAAIMEAMRGAGGASQKGAVETKDMASMGGAITAIAGRFSGDKVRALQTASVLSQVARTKSRSPEEAVTAASNFVDMLGSKSDKVENLGIKGAFQKDSEGNVTGINDPLSLIQQIFEKTGGDLGTITKIFGQRGQRVIEGFRGSYEADGAEGIKKQWDELFNAKLSDRDIKSRAASRLSDPDLKLKDFVTRFNAQVGQELIPVLERLIPEFEKLLPHIVTAVGVFGKLAEKLINSPLSTVGTMIAGKVAADLAAARIGDVVKSSIESSLSGGSGSGTGSGSPTGGIGAAAINGLTIGTATAMTIYATGVVNFEASEARMDQAGGLLKEARGLDLSTTSGRERLSEIRRSLQDKALGSQEASTFERFLGFMTTPMGTDSSAAAEKGKRLNAEVFGQRNLAEGNTYDAMLQEIGDLMREAGKQQLEAAKRAQSAASTTERAADKMASNNGSRTTGISDRGS